MRSLTVSCQSCLKLGRISEVMFTSKKSHSLTLSLKYQFLLVPVQPLQTTSSPYVPLVWIGYLCQDLSARISHPSRDKISPYLIYPGLAEFPGGNCLSSSNSNCFYFLVMSFHPAMEIPTII